MILSRWLALRFLRSKKSHGAVSAIAAVSVAGVAIATAAVVCVLSVFNGFRDVLTAKFDIMAPDMLVTPAKGKVFASSDSVANVLEALPGVKSVMPVVSDKALAVFNGRELPVTIKGTDPELLASNTGIREALLPGSTMPFSEYEEMPEFEYIEDYEAYMAGKSHPEVLASLGAAARLGNAYAGEQLMLFAPRREGRYNPSNPAASFITDSVRVSGVYETRQREYDEDMMIVPIDMARHLFQYEDESSAFELTVLPGTNTDRLKKAIGDLLPGKAVVKERSELQEINFRMVNIEKWVSFLLLVFILLIAGFNIISTMTMLVLEKRRQTAVLKALGMPKRGIKNVFRRESMMVSVVGGLIGIALGVLLCWLQQEFGFIKLAGDPTKLLMQSYPVKLVWSDVAIAFVPCVVLGFISALIAGSESTRGADAEKRQ